MQALRAAHQSPRRRRGFTLIEILIVLAIIGVIAAIAVPNLLGQQREAQNRAARLAIKNLEDACKLYAVNNNGEPPVGGNEALIVLTQRGPQGQTPLLDAIPLDPWNRPLNYQYPNKQAGVDTDTPAIWSTGRDVSDPSDDINNWDHLLRSAGSR